MPSWLPLDRGAALNAAQMADARMGALAAAHDMAARRRQWRACLRVVALVAAVLGPLVLYPLTRLVLLSAIGEHGPTLTAYRAFFASHDIRNVLGTTLWVLLASAGGASLLGILLAALLFFRPFPGASLITRFLELYVAFPSFLVAFTLVFLYGSQGAVSIGLQRLLGLDAPPLDFLFGASGVIFAQMVFYTPFVVRPTLAAFATLDPRLVEAASSL
ncbi:MAG: 2-aminoethylphosphonate ABC transporter permease subunit, partial [Burkholderiaceae bacterium]|nr:2-aminoethylphosphonate ABC transporter permease subunit [Burkholderiaceae bacterium]